VLSQNIVILLSKQITTFKYIRILITIGCKIYILQGGGEKWSKQIYMSTLLLSITLFL